MSFPARKLLCWLGGSFRPTGEALLISNVSSAFHQNREMGVSEKNESVVKSGGVKEGKIRKQKHKKSRKGKKKGNAGATSNNPGPGAVTDGNKDNQPGRKNKKAKKKEGLLKSGGQKRPGNRKQFGIKQVFASKYAPAFPSYEANLVNDVDIRGQIERALKRRFQQFDEDGNKAIVFGVNEVTKCLERNKLDIVVTSRDVSPMVLIAHLPALCYVSDVGMVIFQGRPEELSSLILKKWLAEKGARKTEAKNVTKMETEDETANRTDIKTEAEAKTDAMNGADTEMKSKTKAEEPRKPPASVLAFGILKNKLPELVKELESITVNLDFPWLAKLGNHEENNDAVAKSQRFNFPFPAPRMIAHRRKVDRQQVTKEDCMSTLDLNAYRLTNDAVEANEEKNEDGMRDIDGANNNDDRNTGKVKNKGKSKAKPKGKGKNRGDISSTTQHHDDGDSIMKDV